jgi:hypothetical protein
MRRAVAAGLTLAALCCVGCTNVRPWERELHAREEMAWTPDPLEAQHRAHVYFSKEATLPGGSAGGGGCGCN